MHNFTFYSPTYFVFGREEEKNPGEYVKPNSRSRLVVLKEEDMEKIYRLML